MSSKSNSTTRGVQVQCVASQNVGRSPSQVIHHSGANCLILISKETSELWIVDPNCDGPLSQQPIPLKDRNGFAANKLFSLRRDLTGTLFLKTSLSTSAVAPAILAASDVQVELCVSEALKLRSYLESPLVNLTSDHSKDVLLQLSQQLGVAPTQNKWSTVSLVGRYEAMQSLFNSILNDLKKSDSGSPFLPVVAGILERLALFKTSPYNFELSLDGNGIDKSVMASEAARRLTFSHWPHMHYRWALPEQMAQAGFYHQPNSTGDDRVMCFTCSVCLVCWEPSDEPWSEHERHSPQCPFVRGDYTHNVPVSLTFASTPAVEHNLKEEILSLSTTSRSPWVAVATEHGALQLWHVNRLPQKDLTFWVDLSDAYIAMKTTYMLEGRRWSKVRWSDESNKGTSTPTTMSCLDAVVVDSIKEVISDMTANEIATELLNMGPSREDLCVTSICCCGKPISGVGEKDCGSQNATCSTALIVGFRLDEKRLRGGNCNSMVEALNSANKAGSCSVRIVPPDSDSDHKQTTRYHPFILLYKIDETASLLVLQCFRLPGVLDAADFRIDSIVPSTDGYYVLLVVNRDGPAADDEALVSALLLYGLTFTGQMTGLLEQPVKERLFRGGDRNRIRKALLIPYEYVGFNGNKDSVDAVLVLTERGNLNIVDMDIEEPVFSGSHGPKYVDITTTTSDHICGLTSEGELCMLQISPPVLEQEDALESSINDILNDPLHYDVNKFLGNGISEELMIRSSFSSEALFQAWELTRSDSSHGVHFIAAVPPCWTEVQQHQRRRKNPQHYLREEKLTKSWNLTTNGNTWREHIFQLILPGSVNISHIDFRFSLHAMCYGAPDIQVTLLRKRNKRREKAFDRAVGTSHTQSSQSNTVYVGGVETEVVFGPYDIGQALDLTETAGLVQMTSPVLQSNKSREFILLIRALSEESDIQKSWKQSQKVEERGRSYQQHLAAYYPGAVGTKELLWKSMPLKSAVDVKKMEDRKGCDWIEEISVTVWKTKPCCVPRERFQRTCLIASGHFHREMVRILRAEKGVEPGGVACYQLHLVFDLCSWLFSHWNCSSTVKLMMAFAEDLLTDIPAFLRNSYVRGTRSIAHKCSVMVIEMLSTLRKFNLTGYRDMIVGLIHGVRGILPSLSRFRSSASLAWLLALFSYLARCDPFNSRDVLKDLVSTLLIIGSELETRKTVDSSKLDRYGLTGSPMELRMYEWSSPVLSSQLWRSPTQQYTYANVAASGSQTYSTAWFSSEIGQDELDWGQLLNVDSSEGEFSPNFGMGVAGGWMSGPFRPKAKRSVLSREHLQGLLEVEPLVFSCHAGSDGVKVENLETGVTGAIGGGVLGSSTGPGPIPLPDVAQVEGSSHSNPALASAVTSMKQQVQSILSKQMQLLALQQQKQKLTGKLQEHAAALSATDPSCTPATQGSSASTFGVPTTPKTTPFMTPTPLSPSQLSPINSETNLLFEEETDTGVADVLLEDQQKEMTLNLMPLDLLKPPPLHALILDRMSSGARKYVVVDFGRPVLLSDLVVPSSGELASICIDVWLKEEGVDGQRLVVCNDITFKSLVVSDLQPPALCRFLKDGPLASGQLKRLLEEEADEFLTREAYKECLQLKLQWNLAVNVLERFGVSVNHQTATSSGSSWLKAPTDQLKTTADIIFGALARVSRFVVLCEKVEVNKVSGFLDLKTAVSIFRQFCVEGSARVQALCSAWLFQWGACCPWWGEFFVILIEELYSNSSSTPNEGLFMLLCYLAGQSVKADNRNIVVDLLKLLLRCLECSEDKPVDFTLLSWLLYMLSACFDVATAQKKRGSRWNFLVGDYSSSSRDSSAGDREGSRKKLARKPATKVKWEETAGVGVSLMEEQYQKTLQLAEDIKHYVGKSSKPPFAGGHKVKRSDSSSSKSSKHSKKGKHTRKRSKSSIRLKIPEELSTATAKALTKILISSRPVLPPLTALVASKIIARVCSESGKPVALWQILNKKEMESFLELALDGRRAPWLRHAIFCIILDVLEAELRHRPVGRIPGVSMQLPTATSAAHMMPSTSQSHIEDDIPSATGSHPDTPASAQQAIDAALADIEPDDVPGCPIDHDLRKKYLKMICKEIIHLNLNSGMSFSGLKSWVKSTTETERNLACSCTTVQQYKSKVNKVLHLQASTKEYMMDFLQTPLSSLASTLPTMLAHGPPAPYPLSDTFPVVVTQTSSAPVLSSSPGYAEAKEKLSKLCEQLKLTNVSPSAYLSSIGSAIPSTADSNNCAIVVDMNNMEGEEASGSGESGQGTQTEADECLADGATDVLHSLSLIGAQVTCLEVEVKKNVELLQPVSLALDERAECHLGWRSEAECRRSLLLDDTLCRMALRTFVPLSKPVNLSGGDREDSSKTLTATNQSLECLSSVLSSFFSTLTASHSVAYVERLLTFFWNVLTGITATETLKSCEPEPLAAIKSPILPLTTAAVRGLMFYLSRASDISEKVWTLAFRVLTSAANIRDVDVELGAGNQNSGMAGFIVENRDFHSLLSGFIEGSLGRFSGSGPVAGPAVVEALGTFLTRLHIYCDVPERPVGIQLKVSVIDVVINTLETGSRSDFPVDVMSKVIEFLLGQDFSLLPGETLSRLVSCVAKTTRKFLMCCEEISCSTLGSGAVNPRYCFQSGQVDQSGTEFKTFTDKHDILIGNLLRLCHEICATPLLEGENGLGNTDDAKTRQIFLVDSLLDKDGSSICEDLLGIILKLHYSYRPSWWPYERPKTSNLLVGVCGEGIGAKRNTGLPILITVADWVLQVLTTICCKTSKFERWLRTTLSFLSAYEILASERCLSGPLIYFFVSLLNSEEKVAMFLKLGGGKIVCEQIMRSLSAPGAEDTVCQSKLMRNLSSVAHQIAWSEAGISRLPSKKPMESKVEGMTNFAPLCQITSSSPMAHHLSALLTSTPPHRRARTAAWTYHFYPAEMWLDLVLTLPHPILLKEIQIRPHLPSLQTGPGAVQIELGSDANPYGLTLLGPPVSTTGCSKIRISTEGFQRPAQLVKIHVKRPTDSANMGMSQILLLGNSPLSPASDSTDSTQETNTDFGYWISFLHHILKCSRPGSLDFLEESSLFTVVTSNLVYVFLSRTASVTLRNQLTSVLASLDGCCQDASVVDILLDHCCRHLVREHVFPWLNDILYYLCVNKYPSNSKTTTQRVNSVAKVACDITRGQYRNVTEEIAGNILWCTACICWDSGYLASSDLFSKEIILALFARACDERKSWISDASSWLLCSLCRNNCEVLESFMAECGLVGSSSASSSNLTDDRKRTFLTEGSRMCEILSKSPTTLKALSRIALSTKAATHLLETGVLQNLADFLEKLCSKTVNRDGEWKVRICSFVEFFANLSEVAVVKEWLLNAAFVGDLLKLITEDNFGPMEGSGPIERWTIRLVQSCVACHFGIGSGGLSGSLQELVLCTLLDEERLVIVVETQNTPQTTFTNGAKEIRNNGQRFRHPKYGCLRKIKVLKVSSFSTCQELLPFVPPAKYRSGKTEKKVSISQDLWNPQMSGMLNPNVGWLSDFAYSAEYAKSKGSGKTDAQEEESSDKVQSFLTCRNFPSMALPGQTTIGEIYYTFLSHDDSVFQFVINSISDQEAKPPSADFSGTGGKSTLEVFAAEGGLALLAQHLQLYQPCASVRPPTYFRAKSGYYSEKDLYLLEQQKLDNSLDPPFYDTFEFIDMAPPGVSAAFYPESHADVRERLQSVATAGLSPHVVVAFSVFLRLNGYAELLVGEDRRRAQRLLRLTMGISSMGNEGVWSLSDNDSLSLLPFMSLGGLYFQNPCSTDEGRLIRKASIELAIPEILLACLSAFGHQQPRVASEEGEFSETLCLIEQLLNSGKNQSTALSAVPITEGGCGHSTSTEERNQFWAKGTGFGTGTTQQQWNMDLHVMKRKQDEENVTCLLKVLANFITPVDWRAEGAKERLIGKCRNEEPLEQRVVSLLRNSCVVPTLVSYLRNDSVLDISRHTKVYESVLQFICALALNSSLTVLLTEETSDQTTSLSAMLYKLRDCIQVYMQKLKPLSEKTEEEKGTEAYANEEGLMKLVPLLELCTDLVSHCAGDSSDSVSLSTAAKKTQYLSGDERYVSVMRELQYESVRFFDQSGSMCVPYHYESSVRSCRDSGTLAPRVRRLAQEAVTLSTSLPLSASSSVFVRAAEERLDVMKVLITGPEGTPYWNGCFEFDIWFPADYPTSPMHVNLQTTGGHSVRFNPNLYNDGKVCLSVLNTWHGRPEERWNSQTSSFLQVLVSIQSLILVPDPYFNEPGYERSRGTQAGQQAAREYDANIRQATIRWAMVEMLRNPSSCFKDVIRRHFWFKKDEVLGQVAGWIAEMEAQINPATSAASATSEKRGYRNFGAHLASLKRHAGALKEELGKLEKVMCENDNGDQNDLSNKKPSDIETEKFDFIDSSPGLPTTT